MLRVRGQVLLGLALAVRAALPERVHALSRQSLGEGLSGAFKDGDVRLTSYPKGRVQVYKDGRWGTLCGHWWCVLPAELTLAATLAELRSGRWNNEHGASNICKQLGYQAGGTKYNAPGGSGPVVAGQVECRGGEATVFDCSRRGDPAKCSHRHDQGVDCKGERAPVTEHQRKLDRAG